jgi:hypothetical protein
VNFRVVGGAPSNAVASSSKSDPTRIIEVDDESEDEQGVDTPVTTKDKGKGKAKAEPTDKSRPSSKTLWKLQVRYDPKSWPQEAIDIFKPMINAPKRLTEKSIMIMLHQLAAHWVKQQTPEFFTALKKTTAGNRYDANKSFSRQQDHAKTQMILRLATEIGAICGVGPPKYSSAIKNIVAWLQEMSVRKPYMVRSTLILHPV